MDFVKLEFDLTGLNKEACYVLDQGAVALAPALAESGVPFVALDSTVPVTRSVRPCQGEGRTGVTNLEAPPPNWSFTDAPRELDLGRLVVAVAKSANGEEERFVYGEVLIPDFTDTQGTTISPELVRQTSHEYMANFQQIGLQHRRMVTGKAVILESYLAPVDFELAGSRIAKGTWMMGVRVLDDRLWGMIKAGELTGFSIGGWGKVEAL